jgi:hypothetical protein
MKGVALPMLTAGVLPAVADRRVILPTAPALVPALPDPGMTPSDETGPPTPPAPTPVPRPQS